MVTARLHDGSSLEVTVLGDGPAILLPVRTAVIEGETAEQMRAWGADPQLGHTLATGLAEAGLRVVAADYEGHLAAHPQPRTLTGSALAADLLAVADAAGADRFAYYGYSWLALAGLNLATRTDRLDALVMGGFPPLGAPYAEMLAVTRAAYQLTRAERKEPVEVVPGDWDSAEGTQTPEQAQQYLTLYESLQGFDERAALAGLTMPRLTFAGAEDTIVYGPKWGNARVVIGDALSEHREELVKRGWTVKLIPGADHMVAMQAAAVLPILVPWLVG